MDDRFDLTDFWPEFEAEVRENVRQLEEGLLTLDQAPDSEARVHDLMRLAHTVKGAARLMTQEAIAARAAALEQALREVREGQRPVTPDLKAHLLDLLDDLSATLDAATPGGDIESAGDAHTTPAAGNGDTPSSPAPAPSAPAQPSLSPARVDSDRLDSLTVLGTVLHIQHMRLREIGRRLDASLIGEDGDGRGVSPAHPMRALAEDFHTVVEEMETSLRSLESALLDMRLVPFDVLAPVLRRVVRDAARSLGKRANLIIEGGHVHIDRQLVGPLQDVLIHLLRNALDHGIAAPEERQARGKTPVGTVRIRVRSEGNTVSIRVEDDGRGVDIARVRARAVERGLLLPSEAETLSERDALRLLFRPGFTTRDTVGTFSGQGVGLDAVATIVRRLGGEVDIESTRGEGTAIIIRVPTNLALSEVVIARVGPCAVAFPLTHVEAILPREETVFLDGGARRMVRWQDAPIPLLSMTALFDLPEEGDPGRHVLILRAGKQRAAVEGLTARDQVTLALRPLPPLLEGAPYVYGASILGDSSVIFVMSAEPLVRRAAEKEEPRARREREPERPPRVLVVDDGVTTRDMLRSALTAAGYEVLTAGDGEEALQVLSRAGPVDLIITDVQMPRVDGIALTRRLRSDPTWRDVPIIILTIQARPEDIRRGMEAGATAYLTKQDFEEGTLLETIERVL